LEVYTAGDFSEPTFWIISTLGLELNSFYGEDYWTMIEGAASRISILALVYWLFPGSEISDGKT